MPNPVHIPSDCVIEGTLVPRTLIPSAGCVSDEHVRAGANLAASKLEHQHQPVYAQGSGTTAAAATHTLHVVRGQTGVLVEFVAGLISPNVGAAVVTVDLKKNGTSVLDDPIELTNSHAARELVTETIITTAAAAEDVYEIVVTATAGGGTLGTGVFCQMIIRETAAP